MADSDSSQDGGQRRCHHKRGWSYAAVTKQLSDKVDSLHEQLRQLQLENRDLKLRQEVLERWCRINRLALQVMHTCGDVLMRGQQQDLPRAAIAAIEGTEQQIQQQLVDPGPQATNDATELPPPRGGSGSSASCTLHGDALSLQEYALRCLLAHPQRYAHVSGLTDPDAALAEIDSCREQARRILSDMRTQAPPGSSHQQQPVPEAGAGSPKAAAAAAAAAAAPEAALQGLPAVMLHLLTLLACAQLVDPAITYSCVHRVVQLAGPVTKAKLQAMVAALQLSDEQRAQIAARVRVVSQLLAPVNAAWDQALRQMREVLLSMQLQHVHLQGRTLVAAVHSTAAAGGVAAAGLAGGADGFGGRAAVSAAAPTSQSRLPPQHAAEPNEQDYARTGTNRHNGSAAAPCTAEAAAADLHTRLTHLVQRLNTMHRTLGWLEMTQAYAGLGMLSWKQMGQLLVVSDPYPMLPRYVMNHIASQWEEEHRQAGADNGSSGAQGGLDNGWAHRLRPRNHDGQVMLQYDMGMDEQPPQQQQQQQQQQQAVASVPGTSAQVSLSSQEAHHNRRARQHVSTGKGVRSPGSGTGSLQRPADGKGGCMRPSTSHAWVAPTDNTMSATRPADLVPPALQPDHPHVHSYPDHRHQQPQLQPVCVSGPVVHMAPAGLGPGTLHLSTAGVWQAMGAAAAPGPLPALPAHHMVERPSEGLQGGGMWATPAQTGAAEGPQRGGLLQNLLQLCDVVLETGPQGVPGQEEAAGAALDALLDMLLQ